MYVTIMNMKVEHVLFAPPMEEQIKSEFKERLRHRLRMLMEGLGKDFQIEVSEPEYPEVGERRIRFTIYVDLDDEEYFTIRRKIFTIINDIIDTLKKRETLYSNGAFYYAYIDMDEVLRNLVKITHVEILPRRFYHEARRVPQGG